MAKSAASLCLVAALAALSLQGFRWASDCRAAIGPASGEAMESRVAAAAQPVEPTEAPARSDELRFSKSRYVFGRINAGGLVRREIVLENRSGNAVVVKKQVASCGCTAVDEFRGRTIPAGGDLAIGVTLSSESVGTRISRLTVQFEGNQPAAECEVAATYYGSAVFSPTVLKWALRPGEKSARTVRLRYDPASHGKLRFDGASVDGPGVLVQGAVEVDDREDVALGSPFRSFDVEFRSDGSLPVGAFRRKIDFSFRGESGEIQRLVYQVAGYVESSFRFSTGSLVLTTDGTKQAATIVELSRDVEGKPEDVPTAEVSPGLAVRISPVAPGRRWRMEVSVQGELKEAVALRSLSAGIGVDRTTIPVVVKGAAQQPGSRRTSAAD